jgi:hypothetical protein
MTAVMLACGAVAGPMFLVAVAIQELTRTGVDPGLHPLSLLSLGDLGWVQITNFVVTGVLNLTFAGGLCRARGPAQAGTVGPLLIAGYGVGLIVAGVFVRDPGSGFPPGVAEPAAPSWHDALHGLGAILAFGSLIGACGVFARRFASRDQPGWVGYCAGTGVLLLGLVLLAQVEWWEGAALHAAAVAGWGWTAALAVRFLTTVRQAEEFWTTRSSWSAGCTRNGCAPGTTGGR